MGIMVEYKEIWSLSPLHCGVSSYPWTALFQATVQEENTFLSYVKLCYSESSLMLTHLNLLLPLSHILSELKGDFFSFLSDLQRLSFLWNGKPHGSALKNKKQKQKKNKKERKERKCLSSSMEFEPRVTSCFLDLQSLRMYI